MKVLIGVDGSEGSLAAVQLVGRLISAADKVGLYYSPPAPLRRNRSDLEPARQELLEQIFAGTKARLPQAISQQVEWFIGTESPRQEILAVADKWQPDLVALGARGWGPVSLLRLGSVSRSVIHDSKFPVLVVRTSANPPSQGPLRLLLALDRAGLADQTADLLSQLSFPPGSEGKIIRVLESALPGELPDWLAEQVRSAADDPVAQAFRREREDEKKQTTAELAKWAIRLPAPFQGQEPIVVEGHAAEEILRVIQAQRIDLVAVGARGLGTWGRLVLGSTSETLLVAAPCSVLIVPQGTDEA